MERCPKGKEINIMFVDQDTRILEKKPSGFFLRITIRDLFFNLSGIISFLITSR